MPRGRPPGRTVVISLIGIAALSTALRAVLAGRVAAATVFDDELGYAKLAVWLLLEVAFYAALFDDGGIHQRFLI